VLYFDADPRDGGHGAACDTCCCTPIGLRLGETNLMNINYAPWSVPIAPPGIVPTLEFSVTHNESTCPTGAVDGFLPPTNTNYLLTTPAGTVLSVDLAGNAAPNGNAFTFEIVQLSGPHRGTLTQTGNPGDGTFDYAPSGGQTGYDYFSYRMTDAQGRSVVRTVQVSIGAHADRPNLARMSLVPFIDVTRIKTDQRLQIVSFPIFMPLSCRPCDEYRLTVRQPAQDCERNVYNHLACFDIRCRDCG
jgi:hypothetical protein